MSLNFRVVSAVFTLAFTHFINAQVVLTSKSMPSAGDTIRYSTVSIAGANVNVANTGAGYSWDFSNLVSNGQDLNHYYAANKTPYFFYFFNQLGLKTADSLGFSIITFKNIYSFYSKSSSVFKAEGIGYSFQGIPLAANYTDEDEIYSFPLQYNDRDTSTFRFVFSIPLQTSYSLVQRGTRINNVDGWGSIKTPYKTYDSVLRVKVMINETDTLETQFGKFAYPRSQVIYQWLSPEEKIPVLEITGTEVANTFTPTQIRFRDAFNGKGNANAPHARFAASATSGFAHTDTFRLTDQTTPFATAWQWQITPSSGVQYVKNTTASSRNPYVVFTQKGTYSVTLIASNFAGSDDTTATDLFSIDETGSIRMFVGSNRVCIYPNPCKEGFNVSGVPDGTPVQILSQNGRSIFETRITNGHVILPGRFSPGLYQVRILNSSSAIIIRP